MINFLGHIVVSFNAENWPEENTSAVRQTSQDEGVAATLREVLF